MVDPNREPGNPFDRRLRDELRSIPVPPGLRDRILAGRKTIRPPASQFWRPVLAAAAAIALLATALFLWQRPPGEDRTLAGFQNRMAAFAVRQYRMDFLTGDLAELRARLASGGGPAPLELPAPLRSAPLKGGAKLTWQGQPVSMLCFAGPDAKTLYLFVIAAGATLRSEPPGPVLQPLKTLATATWTRGAQTYFLAADLPAPTLKNYL